MAKRPKRPRDVMQLAKLVGDIATGQVEDVKPVQLHEAHRKGGLKGGRQRARKLSARRRKAIAKAGARARWKKG